MEKGNRKVMENVTENVMENITENVMKKVMEFTCVAALKAWERLRLESQE